MTSGHAVGSVYAVSNVPTDHALRSRIQDNPWSRLVPEGQESHRVSPLYGMDERCMERRK